MPDTILSIKTALGFDFGYKRIGVAVGQTITATASSLCILKANNGAPRWEEIAALIEQWRPQALIVGLPLNDDGTPHSLTTAAQRFGNRLHGRFNLPVFWIDERLSSHAAQHWQDDAATGKRQLDSAAAKVILESWLNTHALNERKTS